MLLCGEIYRGTSIQHPTSNIQNLSSLTAYSINKNHRTSLFVIGIDGFTN
jgi:hypothetical protein